ncbi:MAG: molybdopterin-synthase adenylyltransferase MoeB [Bacteroidia bacterium]|nr:molybdopterin-synthase adenylyltransferase MoeB [Bacteroidia bacterium]
MFSDKELKRYNRHIILSEIGVEGQEKLKQAKVLVIGAGGLGCPVLQYLTAAGLGEIGIVDNDKIDESNLQRQVLYSTDDIGKYKAETAKDKLLRQNPYIKITSYVTYLNQQNALDIISKYNIIVDGTDNFPTRYLVNDACVILNKPFVFGSIFKFEGQVSVFNYKNGPTYRCLYPSPPAPGEVPNCSEIGVLGILPGMIGTLQANEVIKMITNIGEVLSGKLLAFDALSMNVQIFEFTDNPENKKIKGLSNYETVCSIQTNEITSEELKSKINLKEKFQLIDVREEYEHELKNIGGELIPLGNLLDNLSKIQKGIPVIIYCQSGLRSKKAAELLSEKGYKNIFSLKNGVANF